MFISLSPFLKQQSQYTASAHEHICSLLKLLVDYNCVDKDSNHMYEHKIYKLTQVIRLQETQAHTYKHTLHMISY